MKYCTNTLLERLPTVSAKALCLGSLCFLGQPSFSWEGPTDNNTWNQLKSDVSSAKQTLIGKIAEAEAAGLPTEYAKVTQTVVELFEVYAQHDRDNPSTIQNQINDLWWGANLYPPNYHLELPFDEMADTLEITEKAIEELQRQIDGEVTLQSPIDFKTGTMTLGTTYWELDNKPAFPSSFNFIPNDEGVQEAFGRKGGWYYPLSELKQDGTVHSWATDSDVNDINGQIAQNRAPHVSFLGYQLNDWMRNADPALEVGRRHFLKWDIDNPNIRNWIGQFYQAAFPPAVAASGSFPRVHLLANEPHMGIRENGWAVSNGISEATKDKYRDWLINRYGNNISQLNAAYGTNHATFTQARNAIPFLTTDSNPNKWGVPLNLQGGPIWYDMLRFNQDRVTEWFQYLKNQTNVNDPANSPTTIKILGWSMMDNYRDGGIDIEALAKLQGVMGSDFTGGTGAQINTRNPNEIPEWFDRYTLNWIQQTMGLDFYKSVSPNKPFFDSEWHVFDGEWRDFDMPPEYVRAMAWLGFTHGYSMVEAWAWSRNADGTPNGRSGGWLGEILTLPRALDAYGRVMKELNAHSERVADLAETNRKFHIFYCEDSAIQDTSYMEDLTQVYEAVKMLNLPIGFTTPSEIGGLNAQDTVIVPRTPFIANSSLANIQNFPGKVVLVDPSNTLGKTEHGTNRGSYGISPFGTVTQATVFTMSAAFESILSPLKPTSLETFTISDTALQPAYGVLVKQTPDPVSGQTAISLINVSRDSRRVDFTLSGSNNALLNLLTGETLSRSLTLAPYDVFLVQPTFDANAPNSNSAQLAINIEAETYSAQSGVQVVGGSRVGYIQNGDWISFDNLLVSGAGSFTASAGSNTSGGNIEVRSGSPTGTLLGTVNITGTGGWNTYQEFSTPISLLSGPQSIYLVFTGGSGFLLDVDKIRFDVSTSNQQLGSQIEAEDYDAQSGVQIVDGYKVGYIENGDWIRFDAAEISGANYFSAELSSGLSGGTLEIRSGAVNGALLGSVSVGNTGGWHTFSNVATTISEVPTVADIYVVFTGGSGFLLDIASFQFDELASSIELGRLIQAEEFDGQSGIQIVGGSKVGYVNAGDWILFNMMEIAGANSVSARVSSDTTGGNIEVRSGSPTGPILGTLDVPTTGGWSTFQTVDTQALSSITDNPDIYFVFTGGSGFLLDVDWLRFD